MFLLLLEDVGLLTALSVENLGLLRLRCPRGFGSFMPCSCGPSRIHGAPAAVHPNAGSASAAPPDGAPRPGVARRGTDVRSYERSYREYSDALVTTSDALVTNSYVPQLKAEDAALLGEMPSCRW